MAMRKRSVKLGMLVGLRAGVAIAAPQGFVPLPIASKYQNTTTIQPTETESACGSQCSVYYPALSAVQWVPESEVVFTEKVVVATVWTTIYTSANSTLGMKTSTEFVPGLGRQYSLYSLGTNAQGTAELTLEFQQTDGRVFTSTLVYPTPYLDYSAEYHWGGVLQTYDKEFNVACETIGPELANVPLRTHPEYPQPKQEFSPGRGDAYGNGYLPLLLPAKDEPDAAFFQAAFSSEEAFSSCASEPADVKSPTQYEAPLFLTETSIVTTSPRTDGVVIIQPTATGLFDEPTTSKPPMHHPDSPHIETSMSDLDTPNPTPPPTSAPKPPAPHIETSAPSFGPGPGNPQAQQSNPPTNVKAPSFADFVASIIINNPAFFPAAQTPAPTPPPATPTFTLLPTTLHGTPTLLPAFLLPSGAATTIAFPGQTVTLAGQTTVLEAPEEFFTVVSTTINGIPTSTAVWVLGGTRVGSVGETVVLGEETTVLAGPVETVYTLLATVVNGVSTLVPGYVVGGTRVGMVGETVTLEGGRTSVVVGPVETGVLDDGRTSVGFGAEGSATGTGGPVETGGARQGAAGRGVEVELMRLLAVVMMMAMMLG
ncbi:hypothetical protein EJ04DRAFT_577449 [Polyplosphaeria fusca]|uniref:Uncharacterized protein n=1 Tax=Polyplosphaeria fusca TaxID=682080 RepID=A0A9P4QWI6_9PLEO|nr:hypothetical protein EJ04DRAFT_577449 [Polyplosphaeria fusca]